MDPLSEILTAMTVVKADLMRFESSAPFGMSFEGGEHVRFGAVLSGSYKVWVDGEPAPACVEQGDCFVLTDGRPGCAFNSVDAPVVDSAGFCVEHRDPDGVVRVGDGPPDEIVVGGQITFDPEGVAWLRNALPPLIHVSSTLPQAQPLAATIILLSNEVGTGAPGEAMITGRLAHILLAQAIRAHLSNSIGTNNWLATITDRQLGRAMQSFHADLAADWTVASLASAAGMSRSSFAERFRQQVGLSPLDYVMQWRMHKVRQDLLTTNLPFAAIAYRNGYRSRTSCSQSFKRMFGYPPTKLRSERDAGADEDRRAGG